ncbi:arginase family protein [Streptomyces sp. NPDC005070]
MDGPEYLYVSLDIDVLDPAFAPGTGAPEPPGLTNRELLPAIRRICHETPVVGMEVVEVVPDLDPGYTTTMNARRAIFEALTGIAMRRKGLPGPDYLAPAVSGPPYGRRTAATAEWAGRSGPGAPVLTSLDSKVRLDPADHELERECGAEEAAAPHHDGHVLRKQFQPVGWAEAPHRYERLGNAHRDQRRDRTGRATAGRDNRDERRMSDR